jgi:carbamoyltransferase
MMQALHVGDAGYAEVERLAALAAADADDRCFERAIGWNAETGVELNERELASAIEPLRESAAAASASDASQSSQIVRQRTAAGFSRRVNALVSAIVERLIARYGEGRVALAGALVSNRGIATAAAAAGRGSLMFAAVPEPSGRALGAALDGAATPTGFGGLALGPEFSEPEIKLALENCRLDYLYEPDWPRLLTRISKMLARGTVVAWFQGPTGFGPRSIGTRSILCDPSNRYARENINRFLRHGSVDDPLPVAMTQPAADAALDGFFGTPFLAVDGRVKPQYRDKLRAAIDSRGAAPVHVATEGQASALVELLELHRQRTGVPGLIDVPLAGANEPCACTPRDAIRTTFSSAIDAIVIGRFLLMKDYWLLRSGTDA